MMIKMETGDWQASVEREGKMITLRFKRPNGDNVYMVLNPTQVLELIRALSRPLYSAVEAEINEVANDARTFYQCSECGLVSSASECVEHGTKCMQALEGR